MKCWSAAYVGLSWQEKGASLDGVACWGLVTLVMADLHAIVLPTFAERFVSTAERAEIAAIFDDATAAWPWRAVPNGSEQPFDVAVFRRGGIDAHVGLVTSPGRMLHITSGGPSCVVSYREGRWSPRLSGFYRHADL